MTKQEFKQLTCDLFVALNQPAPSVELLREWYSKLENIDAKLLTIAYDAIIDLQATPTLENVLQRVKPPKKQVEHVKNKDKLPEPANYQLNGDGRDWARKILNAPSGREAIAVKNAKIALNIKT
jgi:hypothetical protein